MPFIDVNITNPTYQIHGDYLELEGAPDYAEALRRGLEAYQARQVAEATELGRTIMDQPVYGVSGPIGVTRGRVSGVEGNYAANDDWDLTWQQDQLTLRDTERFHEGLRSSILVNLSSAYDLDTPFEPERPALQPGRPLKFSTTKILFEPPPPREQPRSRFQRILDEVL